MEQKIIVGNVSFIFSEDLKKVLLLHRSKEPMKNLWTGVGGKTSFDEDIRTSTIREIKEEATLDIKNLKLKGILKTILQEQKSSWILFVYTALSEHTPNLLCDEGQLKWVELNDIFKYPLPGFIKKIMPYVLNDTAFFEETVFHDIDGNVIDKYS